MSDINGSSQQSSINGTVLKTAPMSLGIAGAPRRTITINKSAQKKVTLTTSFIVFVLPLDKTEECCTELFLLSLVSPTIPSPPLWLGGELGWPHHNIHRPQRRMLVSPLFKVKSITKATTTKDHSSHQSSCGCCVHKPSSVTRHTSCLRLRQIRPNFL